jgi:hypothetical protein
MGYLGRWPPLVPLESQKFGNFNTSLRARLIPSVTPTYLFEVLLSMSLCSNTVRALSRPRIATSRTLLPFLYQTATIQQWQPTSRSFARRNVYSRSRPRDAIPFKTADDDVPFEDPEGKLPPTIHDAQATNNTTMTGTERAAFEKLYKTFSTEGQGRSKDSDGEHEELDQIADECYQDDEDSSSKSLDKVFDAVLKGAIPSRTAQTRIRTSTTGASGPGKEASTAVKDASKDEKKLAKQAEKERLRILRLEERERVDQLLKTAKSDQQLWSILDHEVFEQLRKHDLDKPKPKKKGPNSKPDPPNADLADTRILFSNYPRHLVIAIQTLREHFPTSPLPLTILPTIRALGRSSYALGVTTHLYRLLLRTAWLQHSSYTLIDTLLTDMETNIVEFDMSILDILDSVLKEHDMARAGNLGREMQMVHGMEMWIEGAKKMKRWRDVVADRLGVVEKQKIRRLDLRHDAGALDGAVRGDGGIKPPEPGRPISVEHGAQKPEPPIARDAFDDAFGTLVIEKTDQRASAARSHTSPAPDENTEMPAKVVL